MKKVNLAHVRAEQRQSPGGKYTKTVKEISIALGREPHSLDLAKRHPFDLILVHIPPGKSYCPYHSHGAESELYLVISGRGTIRDKDGTSDVWRKLRQLVKQKTRNPKSPLPVPKTRSAFHRHASRSIRSHRLPQLSR